MKNFIKTVWDRLLPIVIFLMISYTFYWIIIEVWDQFKSLNKELSATIITAATTIMVATLTVVLGKYYERKKDIEAHYRQKKTEIYDEFLREFFNIFYADIENKNKDLNLADYLREWQRKIILWGGQDVLISYLKWMNHIKNTPPDAKSIYLMEDFFLKIRTDLGHSNSRIPKGSFAYFILKEADLFLSESTKDPNITLEELSKLEKKL